MRTVNNMKMWLENLESLPISKNKKIWNLVVSKPEKNIFRLKTAIETKSVEWRSILY